MRNHLAIDAFLRASRTDKNLGERTLKAYRIDLVQFSSYCANTEFAQVEPEFIRGYVESLLARGLKGATVKRKLATLKVFYRYLEHAGLVPQSPLTGLRQRFRTSRQLPKVLSVPEVTRLIRAAHADLADQRAAKMPPTLNSLRNYTIFEVMFATGIRIDEAVQLNIGDIDMDRHSLLIRGKGRKERLLFIYSEEVRAALVEYLNTRARISVETDALFVNRRGARLSSHGIRNVFYRFCREAGLTRHYTPHCLRHTMATLLVENGADIRSVQDILGHSSISTTEIYVHVSEKRKKDVLRTFNQRDQLELFKDVST